MQYYVYASGNGQIISELLLLFFLLLLAIKAKWLLALHLSSMNSKFCWMFERCLIPKQQHIVHEHTHTHTHVLTIKEMIARCKRIC